MTPEEYERFKEAEKAHLRQLREVKKMHEKLSRKARITQAVTDMTEGVRALFNEHEEMIARLERDTFESEARLDVALDHMGADDIVPEEPEAADSEVEKASGSHAVDSSAEYPPEKTIGRMKR